MKRMIKYSILLTLLSLLIFPTMLKSEKGKIFGDISMGMFSNSDADFRKMYKSWILIPELEFGYYIMKNIYVFTSFEFYNVKGSSLNWNLELSMSEVNIMTGGGYNIKISDKLRIMTELGILIVNYKEEIKELELENKGSSFGLLIRTKIAYKIKNNLSPYIKISFKNATDQIEELESNFGGFVFGMGVIILF